MTPDRPILQKVLFLLLFLCMQHVTGFIPGLSASMEAKACVKRDQIRPLLLELQSAFHLPPKYLPADTEDDWASIRSSQSRRRLRFYQATAGQQFNFSPRTVHFAYDHSNAVIAEEKKAGEYQHHDSFLPAYYTFLFRYTLF